MMKRVPMRLACVVLTFVLASMAAHAVHAVSLYEEDQYRPLTADRKARAAGDLVTVLIYENTSATTTADTNASRSADVSASLKTPTRDRQVGLATNNDFEGRGSTQRSGRVLGQLTVTVRGVQPNGDLLLAGVQELEINGEKQTIKLEGRVRSQDINDTNTVLSTRVADARISLVGDGVLAERQKPSWWHRLVTWFGL